MALLLFMTARCNSPTPEVPPPNVESTTAMATGTSGPLREVRLSFTPERLAPGRPVAIEISVEATPPVQFQKVSGKEMHLIAVSQDLSWFRHLHPKAAGKGFETSLTFPEAGEYALFVLFKPEGGSHEITRKQIFAGLVVDSHAPTRPAITPSRRRSGMYEIELLVSQPVADRWTTLSFRIRREGKILETAGGAHSTSDLIIMREGAEDLVYAHSTEGEARSGVRGSMHLPARPQGVSPEKRGQVAKPDAGVPFHANFPTAGRYKLWVEVNDSKNRIATDFVIEVADPRSRSLH